MQKKIIALAVAALAAAPAFAQSNVTISGWISGGFANTHFSGTGTTGYKAENQIADGRLSRLRFVGSEDLGGGLKAEFQVEQRFFSDKNDLAINQTQGVTAANAGAVGTAGAWASGDTFVGLNGGFGRVRIGRMDTYYGDGVLIDFSRATSFQSMGSMSVLNAWGSGMAVGNVVPATLNGRFNNAIRYDTPRFSGFQGSIQWSSNPFGPDGGAAADGSKGGSWYMAANYMQGPIYAGFSFLNAQCEGSKSVGGACYSTITGTARSAGTDKSWRLYGAYTMPMGLKIGFAYDSIHIKRFNHFGIDYKRNSWVLPVSYTFGQHAVYASYGRVGKLKLPAATVADSNANFWNLAYDYGFSRRTSVGVNLTQLSNKRNAGYNLFNGGGYGGALQSLGQVQGAPLGSKVRQIYVGVNHFF